ncbi:MAG: hypothetical protein HY293_06315 [Planctomycetes bacterium]|nr:hypothetical protein [Planctomycetota bacterium]
MTCSKCGREVPAGQSWCEACRAPSEFSTRDQERMKVDVRARVLWADPVEEIRADWLKKGAPAEAVREALRDAVRERHRHFRVRGLQDVLSGLGCLVLGALAGWIFYAAGHGQIHFHSRVMELVFVAMAALPCVGLFLVSRGVRRIASGGAHEKGASDLSELG